MVGPLNGYTVYYSNTYSFQCYTILYKIIYYGALLKQQNDDIHAAYIKVNNLKDRPLHTHVETNIRAKVHTESVFNCLDYPT